MILKLDHSISNVYRLDYSNWSSFYKVLVLYISSSCLFNYNTITKKKNLSSKFWNIISLKFIWIFFSRLSQTFYFCWILLFDFEIYIKYNLNTHLGIYSTSIDENNTFWFCLTSYLTIYLISLRILFYFVLKKIKTLEYFE